MNLDIDKLANMITDALLQNANGDVGTRLAIKQYNPHDSFRDSKDELDLGGRCRSSVLEEVKGVLNKAVLNVYLQPNLTH